MACEGNEKIGMLITAANVPQNINTLGKLHFRNNGVEIFGDEKVYQLCNPIQVNDASKLDFTLTFQNYIGCRQFSVVSTGLVLTLYDESCKTINMSTIVGRSGNSITVRVSGVSGKCIAGVKLSGNIAII
jgi:hypothetical protein